MPSETESSSTEATLSDRVLDTVRVLASEEDPWTSVNRVRQEARKADYDVERVVATIDTLVEREELIEWHGLIAPTSTEILVSILRNERDAEIQRTLLIGKCQRLLKE